MAHVVLQTLCKSYVDRRGIAVRAVESVDLEVRDREFMVLVGPSGCGKSTTLRMIAGLEEISSGTISIDGRVVNSVAPKDRDIAMVFQNYALYPHMTARENMAFGLKLRKLPRREIEARVEEAADMLGLRDLLERKPKELSGGQRQRVAVGRAIVRKPKVFLFDEPLSNLDAKMRVGMRAEIARLHRRIGATMIYVTHDQIEAMTMGDRICVMAEGRVQQVAPPMEIYGRPANLFVAGFMGNPPMNLLRGVIRRAEGGLSFVAGGGGADCLEFILPSDSAARVATRINEPVVLGVRPEDLSAAPAGAGTPGGSACTVDVVEPMGAETLLHTRAGSSTLVVRVAPSLQAEPGGRVLLRPAGGRIHFFDPTSGVALE